MGIRFRWSGRDHTRIHILFEEDWTLTDFQEMVLDVSHMIQSQTHTVHAIANFTFSKTPTSKALVGIPFAINHMTANLGLAIVITDNDFIRHLANTAASMDYALKQRVHIVDSLEMAEQVITSRQKQKWAVAR